jgi:hypothetical protein
VIPPVIPSIPDSGALRARGVSTNRPIGAVRGRALMRFPTDQRASYLRMTRTVLTLAAEWRADRQLREGPGSRAHPDPYLPTLPS